MHWYLTMRRYVWKIINRYYISILLVIIPFVLFLNFRHLLLKNAQSIDELQSCNEHLQKKTADMANKMKESITYQQKLNEELAGYMDSNRQLGESIESWKNKNASSSQAFHGEWWIRAFYSAETDEWQWCGIDEKIYFEKEYIYLIDGQITDDPIYAIRICDRDKILRELSDMGVENIELLNLDIDSMLDSDYYVEMNFIETYNWNRILNPDETAFFTNAKYYPIDLDTMLCIMRNDGGKVYLLDRIMIPGVD